MPAWVLFPTFDQTVKQYGLHNLAPLIMLQVELSSKLYYLNIFPKIVIYLLTVKISDTSCPVCHHTRSIMISPPHYGHCQERSTYQVSTYLMGDTEENWRLPGTKKSTKYREGKLYIHLLATLLTKKDNDIIKMFLLFYACNLFLFI